MGIISCLLCSVATKVKLFVGEGFHPLPHYNTDNNKRAFFGITTAPTSLFEKRLPCLKGGGFCEAKDGGIVLLKIPCRGRCPLSRARLYTVVQEDCIHILCSIFMLLEAERSEAERGFQKRHAAQSRREMRRLSSCSDRRSSSAIL